MLSLSKVMQYLLMYMVVHSLCQVVRNKVNLVVHLKVNMSVQQAWIGSITREF